MIQEIAVRMTPKELLEKEIFDTPLIIQPDIARSFDDLYDRWEDVCHLRLVPVKSVDMHNHYHTFDRDQLADQIMTKFATAGDIFIEDNKFPYYLPKDVRQQIIWINNGVLEEMVLHFIENAIWMYNISQYILFERSNKCTTKLVKGTISKVRHIHFWTKIHT
jgi:hypothetical protein